MCPLPRNGENYVEKSILEMIMKSPATKFKCLTFELRDVLHESGCSSFENQSDLQWIALLWSFENQVTKMICILFEV